jgi:hypothetical protein
VTYNECTPENRAAARAEAILVYGVPADEETKNHMHDVVDTVNALRRARYEIADLRAALHTIKQALDAATLTHGGDLRDLDEDMIDAAFARVGVTSGA